MIVSELYYARGDNSLYYPTYNYKRKDNIMPIEDYLRDELFIRIKVECEIWM